MKRLLCPGLLSVELWLLLLNVELCWFFLFSFVLFFLFFFGFIWWIIYLYIYNIHVIGKARTFPGILSLRQASEDWWESGRHYASLKKMRWATYPVQCPSYPSQVLHDGLSLEPTCRYINGIRVLALWERGDWLRKSKKIKVVS